MIQTARVRLSKPIQLPHRDQNLDLARAGRDDGFGVHAGGVAGDVLAEALDEDVLADGDGEGAAEGVGEGGDCHCVARGRVSCVSKFSGGCVVC